MYTLPRTDPHVTSLRGKSVTHFEALALAGVLSLVPLAHVPLAHAASAPQPQIAFVGDSFTAYWGQQPQFLAHANWLPYGSLGDGNYNANAGTRVALQTVQAIIASGKKPVIFLNVGEADSEFISPGNQHSLIFANWAQGWEQIIKTAQQAKLPVIVSTIPYSYLGDISDMNKWILTYAPAHNIPVVNINYALNSGTGFAASGRGAIDPTGPPIPQAPVYYVPDTPELTLPTLTSQGWDLVTDMANVAIGTATGAIKLKGGYLGTVVFSEDEDATSTAGANQLEDGGLVQFTAYGQYSDGSTHVFNNADLYGRTGTWTNSNGLVMTLDQTGVGRMMDAGTTNVKFVTPSGITLNEWTMTTYVDDPCGTPNCITY
jgi:hypothetical protein